MKIIGKQKDYYDGVGFSESPIFVRTNSELEDPTPKYIKEIFSLFPDETVLKKRSALDNVRIDVDTYLLGFCGRAYPLLVLRYSKSAPYPASYVTYERFIYSISDMNRAFSRSKIVSVFKDYYFRKDRKRLHYASSYRRFKESNLSELFFHSGKKIDDDIFFKLKTPIFIAELVDGRKSNIKISSNPVLKDFKFQSIFDPYAAYQEIEMYLGGVLNQTEVNTVQISDKDMKHQKGFDDWSFKAPPTKKRVRS